MSQQLTATFKLIDEATKPLKEISSAFSKVGGQLVKLKASKVRLFLEKAGVYKFKESVVDLDKAVHGVGKEFKSLVKEVMVVGGVASATLGGIIYKTSNAGAAIYDASQKVGMSVEMFSKLKYAAESSGVSTEVFSTGVIKLNKQIAEAAMGSKQAIYFFKALGIDIKDTGGKLKATNEIFMESVDKISKINNPIMRARASMAYFGQTAGAELLPMINSGTEEIAKLTEKADELGLVFTEEQGKTANDFNNSLLDLKSSVLGITFAIGNMLIPVVKPLIEQVTSILTVNRELIKENVKVWINKITDSMPGLLNYVSKLWQEIKALGKSIDEVVQSFGGWKKVLPKLAIAFVAIKLIPLIASIFTLVKAVFSLGSSSLILISNLKYLRLALLSTPAGIVIASITALIMTFSYLWKRCEGFRNFWKGMWQGITTVFMTFKSIVDEQIGKVFDAFEQNFFYGIYTLLASFNPITIIYKSIRALVELIVDNFDEIKEFILITWDKIIEFLGEIDLLGVGKSIFESFFEGIKLIWDDIYSWFSESFGSLTDLIPSFFTDWFGSKEVSVKNTIEPMPPVNLNQSYKALMQAKAESSSDRLDASITFNNMPRNAQVEKNNFPNSTVNYAGGNVALASMYNGHIGQ